MMAPTESSRQVRERCIQLLLWPHNLAVYELERPRPRANFRSYRIPWLEFRQHLTPAREHLARPTASTLVPSSTADNTLTNTLRLRYPSCNHSCRGHLNLSSRRRSGSQLIGPLTHKVQTPSRAQALLTKEMPAQGQLVSGYVSVASYCPPTM